MSQTTQLETGILLMNYIYDLGELLSVYTNPLETDYYYCTVIGMEDKNILNK